MKGLNVPDERIERSWWKVWAFLMKVWVFLMKGLSVPDERFEHSWGKVWAFLMKGLSVPDERVFQKRVLRTIFYIYVFFLAILLLLFILNGFSLHHICYFNEMLICIYYCILCMYLICYLHTIVLTKVTRNKKYIKFNYGFGVKYRVLTVIEHRHI